MDPARRVRVEEYAALEEASSTKHELVNGLVVAMAGASPRHNAIAANLLAALTSRLRGSGCRTLTSDQRVFVPATELDTYPDVTVVCGPLARASGDRNAVTNPTLLAEVLSDSTEAYDRGAKWLHYQQLPSLREYLLVSQHERRIERYARDSAGAWRYEAFHGGAVSLKLDSLSLELPLDEVFADLPADEPESRR